MDFKKFVSDVSTNLNRAVQLTEEKLGTSERTDYDPGFESLCQRADHLANACSKIISTCEAYLQPNPALRVGNYVNTKLQPMNMKVTDNKLPSEELAVAVSNASSELGPVLPYGESLTQAGDAYRKLSAAQREFIANVETNFLSVFWQFLYNEYKTIKKERDSLDMKRLDLDAAKNKLKKAKAGSQSQSQLEKDVEACQTAFDRQLETTRLLLENVANAYTVHQRALASLVRAEREYHLKCVESLDTVYQSLGNANKDN